MGSYSINLVGESNYQAAIARLRPGHPVSLVHEPTNRYDSDAVKAVDANGEIIGYLERDSWLKRLMLYEGKPVMARIEAITGGTPGKPTRGIVIEVLTGTDATMGFAAPVPLPPAPRVNAKSASPSVPGWLIAVAIIVVLALYGATLGGDDRGGETSDLILKAERAQAAQQGR